MTRSAGGDSIVINPADVPTTDKERRTKTDRVDAAKLARALANGVLTPIYIQERAAQEDRTLVRMHIETVVTDQSAESLATFEERTLWEASA